MEVVARTHQRLIPPPIVHAPRTSAAIQRTALGHQTPPLHLTTAPRPPLRQTGKTSRNFRLPAASGDVLGSSCSFGPRQWKGGGSVWRGSGWVTPGAAGMAEPHAETSQSKAAWKARSGVVPWRAWLWGERPGCEEVRREIEASVVPAALPPNAACILLRLHSGLPKACETTGRFPRAPAEWDRRVPGPTKVNCLNFEEIAVRWRS